MDEGLFDNNNGLFYYTDFETNTAVPICNKPDCRHLSTRENKNTTCNAANDDSKILLMLAVSLMKESLFGINYFIFMMRRLILLRAMGYRR